MGKLLCCIHLQYCCNGTSCDGNYHRDDDDNVKLVHSNGQVIKLIHSTPSLGPSLLCLAVASKHWMSNARHAHLVHMHEDRGYSNAFVRITSLIFCIQGRSTRS